MCLGLEMIEPRHKRTNKQQFPLELVQVEFLTKCLYIKEIDLIFSATAASLAVEVMPPPNTNIHQNSLYNRSGDVMAALLKFSWAGPSEGPSEENFARDHENLNDLD
jgi:hypothetical protein